MRRGHTTLKISLSIIIITTIILVGINIYLRVEKPVFINNYCQYGVFYNNGRTDILGQPFILQYINNYDTKKEAINIVFKGYENLYFNISENQQNGINYFYNNMTSNVERVGLYGLHNIYVTIPPDLDVEKWEDILLTEAIIYFNDGTSQVVELGKVELYLEENKEGKVERYSGGSSSDGSFNFSSTITDDIIIEKVDSFLDIKGNDIINVSINSEPVSEQEGKTYKSGDKIYVTGTVNSSADILSQLTRYNLYGEMYYTDTKENKYSQYIYFMFKSPDYTFNNIVKYLKARGKL